ncbi:hydroxymethylglutaryl- reductase [Lecanosticta acicola]|uniref:hydroxymethylglutaryl-CoA reductase (NADPH) n=1 Tax=Lecanosticta acicola TaxID=111012 RepID=A0AAI9EFD2_9PEZI|nr:hydroxymethylglutaryl- reductase [Lecanosticta acicola]
MQSPGEPRQRSQPTTSIIAQEQQNAAQSLTQRLDLLQRMPSTVEKQDDTQAVRVENCVGFAQTPLGLAGPLTINGQNQHGTFHAPLATLEATLVASCSRGCKTLQQNGGVSAAVLEEGMSRAPIFRFKDVPDALAFYQAFPRFHDELKRNAEATSKRVALVSITPHLIGACVHVRFAYTCGAAAGQNMTTIATHAACNKFLKEHKAEFKIEGFMIEGQMASDKKLSWGNVSNPRGVRTVAWAELSDQACREVLGNAASNIFGTYLHGVQAGIRNGMAGYNINVANILAAIFIATGQDAASVLEAGWAQLTMEFNDKTGVLTVFVFFPSLPVGSVGGGTGLNTQREALELINCYGEGKKWRLAETVAAFALALEISTLGAIANDTFSQSHHRLARL